MQSIKSPEKLTKLLFRLKQSGKKIGFVPTMGALHAGHMSLVRRSRRENDLTVVSIFVNPTQFGPKEDFKKYPRTLSKDLAMLAKADVDYIFLPDIQAIYPKNFEAYLKAGPLAKSLCGLSRPGHFDGVATVVKRLFDIVIPERAYFGIKDFQQLRVIENLTAEHFLPVEIVRCPIVREKSGLAMSSRNRYLSLDEKRRATAISKSLKLAKRLIKKGVRNPKEVVRQVQNHLKQYVDRIDYIQIVSARTLRKIAKIKGEILVAVACFQGKARLIDNILIEV